MTSVAFALRVNAVSCLVYGILFAVWPGPVAATLGDVPPGVILGLGIGLLVNGGHLALAAMRKRLRRAEVLWFALGDMAWWLASLALIAAGIWITMPLGVALAALTAVFVAGIGATQLFLLGLERSGLSARAQWLQIGQSWLSLPVWVKTWLFALNAVFLAAPAFLPWQTASVVLIAYVASGPLLIGFVAYAGGLTRATGIGHLVPWPPLLVWLVMQPGLLDGNALGFGLAALLAGMIAVCLVFDLYDVARWLRGERKILGTPSGL